MSGTPSTSTVRIARLGCALLVWSCESTEWQESSKRPAHTEAACRGVSREALTAVDRKLVGGPSPYAADAQLRMRDAELAASQRLRREVAWSTVKKVLSPVALALKKGSLVTTAPAQIPAWQSWYGREELARVFHRAYGSLSTAQRQARAAVPARVWDESFAWNLQMVDDLPHWSPKRFEAYLAAIDSRDKIHGIGGIGHVNYSPAAARHLLSSYAQVLRCREAGPPPAHEQGPVQSVVVMRRALSLAPCQQTSLGPFAIGEDESLRTSLTLPEDHPDGVDSVRVELGAGSVCEGTTCTVAGPGEYTVSVAATAPVNAQLTIERDSSHPEWSACLDGPFPLDSAVVKASWRRAQFEEKLPTFDTSADALAQRAGEAPLSWETPDALADPPPEAIYTLELPSGARYRLPALHIMTKELDHWLWITLFWSDQPDADFGADRPQFIRDLGGPWANYKMCVVTAFAEQDPDPSGGFSADAPSLAAALATVHRGRGTPSWCSNPYLELGDGNAATNCIGCHQHGGTALISEGILEFAWQGRTRLRNNFPTDYSWAINTGDELGQLFADEETFWRSP